MIKKFITIIAITAAVSFTISLKLTAATFEFAQSNFSVISECSVNLNLLIDTTAQQSNAADVIIDYNPTEIEINDSDSNLPGVQIKSGTAYEAYFGNIVNTTTGEIRLTGASIVSSLSARKTFATINFKGRPNVTSSNFTIRFNGAGNTLDSNIADLTTSQDILTSVTNSTVTFTPSTICNPAPPAPDRVGPIINFINPSNPSAKLTNNNVFEILLSDNDSGVNISSLLITINGVELNFNSPLLTITQNGSNYTILIDSTSLNLDPLTFVSIKVNVSDNANNKSVDQLIFNIPAYTGGDREEIVCIPTDPNQTIINSVVNNIFGNNFVESILKDSPFKNTIIFDLSKTIGIGGAFSAILFILLAILFLIFALPVIIRRLNKDETKPERLIVKIAFKILEYLVICGFLISLASVVITPVIINFIILIIYIFVVGLFIVTEAKS